MDILRKYILLPVGLALLLLLLGPGTASSEEKTTRNDFIFGLKGGYPWVIGSHGSQHGVKELGFFVIYTIPGVFRYLAIESDFDFLHYRQDKYVLLTSDLGFLRYRLSESRRTSMYVYSLDLGPALSFPVARLFKPYAGVYFKERYFWRASIYKGTQAAWKPGFGARAGFQSQIFPGFETRLGVEYVFSVLSGKPFNELKLSGGVCFSVNQYQAAGEKDEVPVPGESRTVKLERLYVLGVKEFEAGNLEKAGDYFRRVSKLDSKYRDTRSYLAKIAQADEDYEQALRLASEGRTFEALALMEKSAAHSIRARAELPALRKKLLPEVPSLEKQGIEAYNRQDYRECVSIMNRIRLIDPGNRTYRLYYPRAVKRMEALKKLRGTE